MAADKRYVYVLKNANDKPQFYVGLTSDVDARLAAHNAGRCQHTASRRPWQRHVVLEFSDEERAIRFERYLKSGSGRAFAKRHFEEWRAPSTSGEASTAGRAADEPTQREVRVGAPLGGGWSPRLEPNCMNCLPPRHPTTERRYREYCEALRSNSPSARPRPTVDRCTSRNGQSQALEMFHSQTASAVSI